MAKRSEVVDVYNFTRRGYSRQKELKSGIIYGFEVDRLVRRSHVNHPQEVDWRIYSNFRYNSLAAAEAGLESFRKFVEDDNNGRI